MKLIKKLLTIIVRLVGVDYSNYMRFEYGENWINELKD